MGSFRFQRRILDLVGAALILIAGAWPLSAAAPDSLIGQPVPSLMGRAAFGAGLLKLDVLRRDVIFELDEGLACAA